LVFKKPNGYVETDMQFDPIVPRGSWRRDVGVQRSRLGLGNDRTSLATPWATDDAYAVAHVEHPVNQALRYSECALSWIDAARHRLSRFWEWWLDLAQASPELGKFPLPLLDFRAQGIWLFSLPSDTCHDFAFPWGTSSQCQLILEKPNGRFELKPELKPNPEVTRWRRVGNRWIESSCIIVGDYRASLTHPNALYDSDSIPYLEHIASNESSW
jgi:hypothetical protein